MKISELKKSIFNFLKSNFFNNFEFRIHFEMRDDDRNLLAIDTTVSTSNDKTPMIHISLSDAIATPNAINACKLKM